MPRLAPALLAALFASSCGASHSDTGALPSDAAAGARDAASAGPDVGATGGLDAAAGPLDADLWPGPDASAEPSDAELPPGPDAGGGPFCPAPYAACSSYSDATAPGASRGVSFTCCQYAPKCLRIAAGQSVTFTGSFGAHPLEQACGPAGAIATTSSGSSATFVFTVPGDYGFFCDLHGTPGGTGMAGSILVE